MHRLIQDHLEEVLGSRSHSAAEAHLAECRECREEISSMRQQAALLRTWKAPAVKAPDVSEELAPRPGFYARLMERIEAQRPVSIWQIFSDSAFGRRIAIASMALALLLSVYLVSSERAAADPMHAAFVAGEDQPGMTMSRAGLPDKDTVLVNLVTYREQ